MPLQALLVSHSIVSRVFGGYWKFSIGDRSEWAKTSYEDKEWEEVYVPRRWESEGFNGYDGYAWYRKSFSGNDLRKEKVIYLKLGYIDDVDEVFVNGKKIGFSGGFPPDYYTAFHAERLYSIPIDLINFSGENLIAVRVFDYGGEGGIYTGDVGIYVPEEWARDAIYLEGLWKIKIGDRSEYKDPNYDDEQWQGIMVPSNWKSIGLDDLRDVAWYRKQFEVSAGAKTTGLTLLGGKIDDFDEIFVNGVKIGQTNDGERLGRSQSYSKMRIYDIPNNLLKTGKNVIAVKVTDMGDNGGIYEGPVIILPSSEVSRVMRGTRWSFWR
ncbi:MAG: hypothetical protein ACJAXX_001332 [Roseivirga sp.]